MLALAFCSALLAVDPGSAPAEVRQTYEEARARAGRSPEGQIRLALWCEAHGLTAERLNHLALAALADPANATARGLMGLVAYQGPVPPPRGRRREGRGPAGPGRVRSSPVEGQVHRARPVGAGRLGRRAGLEGAGPRPLHGRDPARPLPRPRLAAAGLQEARGSVGHRRPGPRREGRRRRPGPGRQDVAALARSVQDAARPALEAARGRGPRWPRSPTLAPCPRSSTSSPPAASRTLAGRCNCSGRSIPPPPLGRWPGWRSPPGRPRPGGRPSRRSGGATLANSSGSGSAWSASRSASTSGRWPAPARKGSCSSRAGRPTSVASTPRRRRRPSPTCPA